MHFLLRICESHFHNKGTVKVVSGANKCVSLKYDPCI